jgi:hypothetical protein
MARGREGVPVEAVDRTVAKETGIALNRHQGQLSPRAKIANAAG